jgi:hypothetical protein
MSSYNSTFASVGCIVMNTRSLVWSQNIPDMMIFVWNTALNIFFFQKLAKLLLTNIPRLGPIFHFLVAVGYLHGNWSGSTYFVDNNPITSNGLFCSCTFGPFSNETRILWFFSRKKKAEILHTSCFYFSCILVLQLLKLRIPNLKNLNRSIPAWIMVFWKIHEVDFFWRVSARLWISWQVPIRSYFVCFSKWAHQVKPECELQTIPLLFHFCFWLCSFATLYFTCYLCDFMLIYKDIHFFEKKIIAWPLKWYIYKLVA